MQIWGFKITVIKQVNDMTVAIQTYSLRAENHEGRKSLKCSKDPLHRIVETQVCVTEILAKN